MFSRLTSGLGLDAAAFGSAFQLYEGRLPTTTCNARRDDDGIDVGTSGPRAAPPPPRLDVTLHPVQKCMANLNSAVRNARFRVRDYNVSQRFRTAADQVFTTQRKPVLRPMSVLAFGSSAMCCLPEYSMPIATGMFVYSMCELIHALRSRNDLSIDWLRDLAENESQAYRRAEKSGPRKLENYFLRCIKRGEPFPSANSSRTDSHTTRLPSPSEVFLQTVNASPRKDVFVRALLERCMAYFQGSGSFHWPDLLRNIDFELEQYEQEIRTLADLKVPAVLLPAHTPYHAGATFVIEPKQRRHNCLLVITTAQALYVMRGASCPDRYTRYASSLLKDVYRDFRGKNPPENDYLYNQVREAYQQAYAVDPATVVQALLPFFLSLSTAEDLNRFAHWFKDLVAPWESRGTYDKRVAEDLLQQYYDQAARQYRRFPAGEANGLLALGSQFATALGKRDQYNHDFSFS